MAAEEAARLARKPVIVVRSDSQQGGLAALVEFDQAEEGEANAERLGRALATIRVGAVAPAARDDADGRFRRGDSVGFAGDEIVAWGGAGSTLIDTVAAVADGAEIVTVIAGAEAPFELEEISMPLPDGVELELHHGGTANYSWLIAAQ
jgi:dihydroxyacetone kinase-like predicted kinase